MQMLSDVYSIFSQEGIKQFVTKICLFIAYNFPWNFEPLKYIFPEEIEDNFSIICCS